VRPDSNSAGRHRGRTSCNRPTSSSARTTRVIEEVTGTTAAAVSAAQTTHAARRHVAAMPPAYSEEQKPRTAHARTQRPRPVHMTSASKPSGARRRTAVPLSVDYRGQAVDGRSGTHYGRPNRSDSRPGCFQLHGIKRSINYPLTVPFLARLRRRGREAMTSTERRDLRVRCKQLRRTQQRTRDAYRRPPPMETGAKLRHLARNDPMACSLPASARTAPALAKRGEWRKERSCRFGWTPSALTIVTI
jgi:hypothetical protein